MGSRDLRERGFASNVDVDLSVSLSKVYLAFFISYIQVNAGDEKTAHLLKKSVVLVQCSSSFR